MILHYYYSSTCFDHQEAPAQQDLVARFLAEELVVLIDDTRGKKYALYNTTERGRAWIDLLLETPLPVKKWLDPRKGG
jgi:hypothetical protein